MARESETNRLQRIWREAIEEFDDIYEAEWPERQRCLEDRRFAVIPGAHWEGAWGEQYANRPQFELNRVALACRRIQNEYRNNRITVDFVPSDGGADETADVCDGLFRADLARGGQQALDTAFDEAVHGGIGAFRIRADYEDDGDDESALMRAVFEPIYDADTTVYFDRGAKRQDKADARRCWVLTPYDKRQYEEEFDDNPDSWEYRASGFEWQSTDHVWVCEHYRLEERKEVVHLFRGLAADEPLMRVPQSELDADPGKLKMLRATGFVKAGEKEVRRREVRKYILGGGGPLKDCGVIAGDSIPIVMVFGQRAVVEGIERAWGHVRMAKDAQRLTNMLVSMLAEVATRFDVEKPIFTAQQIAGKATQWARDNVDRFPYLEINEVPGPDGNPVAAGPVGYTKSPNVPPAVAALAQLAEHGLAEILGKQEAGDELMTGISGKAVQLVQQRLDMQAYIYMDNFGQAMRWAGRVWQGVVRDVVVEQRRRMRSDGEDGAVSQVEVNAPYYDRDTRGTRIRHDLSRARFETIVDIGPTSSSKRAGAVQAITGMLALVKDQQTAAVLSMLALANIEGEGVADARKWARRQLLSMGAAEPTEAEREEMTASAQAAVPSAQEQYMRAAAEQAQADASAKRAKAVESVASADLKIAQRAAELAKANAEAQAAAIAGTQSLRDLLSGDNGAAPLE